MTRRQPHLIRNTWQRDARGPVLAARILDHRTCPEGFDVERVRFLAAATLELDAAVGHIVSVLRGPVTLRGDGGGDRPLQLSVTTHAYVPAGWRARIDAPADAEILCVSAGTADQARGTRLLVRDEAFLAASATDSESLRWILTSQYLSRRIFLEHDATLLSKSGSPVSWYRTTMFDVAGLPPNDDDQPVFKMEYDSRTEFNVCYDVLGRARVRMAEHPYREAGQSWGPWHALDGDSTYHLNEAAGGDEEERRVDEATLEVRALRNKHEVHILDGHVTLFCLFDPAATGFERHSPGAYSDYEPLGAVLGSERHTTYIRQVARFDEMVDALSMAQALGELRSLQGSPAWELYVQGCRAQAAHESALLEALAADGRQRDQVVSRWATAGAVI